VETIGAIILSLEQLGNLIDSHQSTVYLLTFVICAIFSFAMLISYRRAKSEKWMRYFGIASAILAGQYFVLVLLWFLGAHNKTEPKPYDAYSIVQFFLRVFSIANNLYFIAAAHEIENQKPVIPKWCKWLAGGALLTTVVGDLLMNQDNWRSVFLSRSLDAVLSAYCLALLGYAIYANISYRIRRWTAFAARFSASIYAIVHIAYWFSPLAANSSSGIGGFKQELRLFDSLLVAIALPLKVLLFIPAYFLLLRFVETLQDLTKLQDESVDARQDYMSSAGVVSLIGKKLESDIDLTILLPGENNRRVALIRWPDEDPERKAVVVDWTDVDPLIRESLSKSEEIIATNDGLFVVIEPIEAHGTAIGWLELRRDDYPFSPMAVRQIKAIANLVSPSVQSYRELAALDLLSISFAERQSEEKTHSPNESAQIIAEILHDIFSPITTSFHLNFGFQTIGPIYLGDNDVAQSMKRSINWGKWNEVPSEMTDRNGTDYKLFKKKLTAKSKDTLENTVHSEGGRPLIGNLVFAVHKAGDERGHPSLGTSYLHRKTAATLASDAYLDFARDYYSSLLKNLGVKLSKRTMSVEEWYKPIGDIASEAGFCFVIAATQQEDFKTSLDDATVARISEEVIAPGRLTPTYQRGNIRFYELSIPIADAMYVIELCLPNSQARVWVGVERPGFGDELLFTSPWQSFLFDFAQIADAALTRVTFASMLQGKQLEAASYQGLATAAATIGTIIHQLSNMVHGQISSTSTLLDALDVGQLTANEETQQLMRSMRASAERMRKLLSSIITGITKTDDRRPSQLLNAVNQADNLFEESLLQRKIKLNVVVGKNLMVDVPFGVASLAIANLIGNAKDAMPEGGEIRIEAEANGDMVLCRVIDQGHGIPPEIQNKVFDIGLTTKSGKGVGWGLYLTKRSLLENRSNIELTKTSKEGSTFTIYFPSCAPETNGR